MKLKTYAVTDYYRGIEIYVLVITTSLKKASEIMNKTTSYLKTYAHINDLNATTSLLKSDLLYAKRGLGGEICYILDHKNYIPLEEMETLIVEHRLICKTYQETIDWYKNK